MRLFILMAITTLTTLLGNNARAEFCYLINECDHFRRDPSSSSPGGSQIRINPSAVPTDKGVGLETIYYLGDYDLSLVRGTGRMGASISPSNSEETFFGAPGFEYTTDYLYRKQQSQKYPNQKLTLATAFDIAGKKGSGFRNYSLKLGIMGKYNKLTYGVTPGAGANATWGPFSFGLSMYKDETMLGEDSLSPYVIKYNVQTYNIGVYLNSLVLNYSHLQLKDEDETYLSTVKLYTASLSLGKFIITGSQRIEDSPDMAYNYETKSLEDKQIKVDYFGGVQYAISRNIMLGFLYNYYLLRESSASATIFF